MFPPDISVPQIIVWLDDGLGDMVHPDSAFRDSGMYIPKGLEIDLTECRARFPFDSTA